MHCRGGPVLALGDFRCGAAKSDVLGGIADMPPACDPDVWSGRSVQEVSSILAMRSCMGCWGHRGSHTTSASTLRTSSDFASLANAEANHVGTPDLVAFQISFNWTLPRFKAPQHARKKVAGNEPRLSLDAIESRVSSNPYFVASEPSRVRGQRLYTGTTEFP